MHDLFVTLGYGFLGLLGMAVLVAGWEHLQRVHAQARRLQPSAAAAASTTPVDVDLARLAEDPHQGDLAQRQTTAHRALMRAARPRADNLPWTETQPMVAPGSKETLDR